jgi:hypothetical protein
LKQRLLGLQNGKLLSKSGNGVPLGLLQRLGLSGGHRFLGLANLGLPE